MTEILIKIYAKPIEGLHKKAVQDDNCQTKYFSSNTSNCADHSMFFPPSALFSAYYILHICIPQCDAHID